MSVWCWRFAFVFCLAWLLVLVTSAPANAASISITRTADISFGQVIASPVGGSLTISTAGARIPNGIAVVSTSSTSQAIFEVYGDNNATYTISLPASVALAGQDSSMVVDTFVSDPSGSGLLSASGTQTVYVGATLHMVAGQHPGPYSGTVDVYVNYN